jgi:stearoyl-CoA desaturase (Delta-9 desaturase)
MWVATTAPVPSVAHLSAPAFSESPASLMPRPDRSALWIICNSVRGTWFLMAIHLGVLGVLLTGTTWLDWLLLPAFLVVRGYITTVGYHRYFSHRAFKTSRLGQFMLGCLCCVNLQRGPLWWAAIHRHHHRHSDDEHDAHSPVTGSLFWAHCGWTFATLEQPDLKGVRDLYRFPELVWLERLWLLPPLLVAAACWLVGGWSMVCLDFCLSAVLVLHGAFLVNSLGHRVGWQRFPTRDQSRNSFVLAFLTLGDGWHNNHHHYPRSANHGFFRGEVDTSFGLIRLLERLGLVWDVRPVPDHKLHPAETNATEPKRDNGASPAQHRL